MIIHVAFPIEGVKDSVSIDSDRVMCVEGSVVIYKNGKRIRTGETEKNLLLLLEHARKAEGS